MEHTILRFVREIFSVSGFYLLVVRSYCKVWIGEKKRLPKLFHKPPRTKQRVSRQKYPTVARIAVQVVLIDQTRIISLVHVEAVKQEDSLYPTCTNRNILVSLKWSCLVCFFSVSMLK